MDFALFAHSGIMFVMRQQGTEAYQKPVTQPLPGEFYERASYDGDCENKPEGAQLCALLRWIYLAFGCYRQ